VDFEIKEENITPQFIEEAKNLVADVTRLMPTGNLVEYTRENMEQQKAKVKDVFTGTESYVKTLLKKGDTARIANVIVQQEKELEKIIQPMNEDFQKLSELMFYVEYKERGETINGINKLIQEWNEYTTHIKSEFDKIKTRF
jgi:hypothetical protein